MCALVLHYINNDIAVHYKLFQDLTLMYLGYIRLLIWNMYHEVRLYNAPVNVGWNYLSIHKF